MMKLSVASSLLFLFISTEAFVTPPPPHHHSATLLSVSSTPDNANYLLDEFKTASGEILDPYKVLKLSRTADRQEIRQAYRTFSRKYHPDGARFRDILPGKCNNHDDIREEWERIKLSYEILIDTRTRKRYDRHSTLADPGAAVQRAVWNGVGWGLQGVGKGLLGIGASAVKVGAGALEAGADVLQKAALENKKAAKRAALEKQKAAAEQQRMKKKQESATVDRVPIDALNKALEKHKEVAEQKNAENVGVPVEAKQGNVTVSV